MKVYKADLLKAFKRYNEDRQLGSRNRLPSTDLGFYYSAKRHGLKAVRKGEFSSYFESEDLDKYLNAVIKEKAIEIDRDALYVYIKQVAETP